MAIKCSIKKINTAKVDSEQINKTDKLLMASIKEKRIVTTNRNKMRSSVCILQILKRP